MTRRTGLWVAAAAMLAILLVVLALSGDDTSRTADKSRARTDAAEPASAPAPAAEHAPADAPGAQTSRETAAPDSREGATLLVRSLWSDDRTPAAGILLFVEKDGFYPLDPPVALHTDGKGIARATSLPALQAIVTSHTLDDAWQPALLKTGAVTTVEFLVRRGIRVSGMVIDGVGQPVEGAEIWQIDGELTPYVARRGGAEPGADPVATLRASTRTQLVAHSAADGTFALERVPTRQQLTAYKTGYAFAPVTLGIGVQHRAEEERPGSRELNLALVLLESEAPLEGRVVDTAGKPIARALLRARSEAPAVSLPRAKRPADRIPLYASTDADGRFRFDGLPPGRVDVSLNAEGRVPWRQSIDLVANDVRTLDIRLDRGASVIGRATGADGNPMAGATVEVGPPRYEYDFLTLFVTPHATTAADGSFRVVGIPAGSFDITAWIGNDQGRLEAHATLAAVDGGVVRWDPAITERAR